MQKGYVVVVLRRCCPGLPQTLARGQHCEATSVHMRKAGVRNAAQTCRTPTWESAGYSPQHQARGLHCRRCGDSAVGTTGDPRRASSGALPYRWWWRYSARASLRGEMHATASQTTSAGSELRSLHSLIVPSTVIISSPSSPSGSAVPPAQRTRRAW